MLTRTEKCSFSALQLQDLAVSPGIRDPKLNTAECVIQGHKPNIDATGVSTYIRGILWCSFFSVMLLGPIVAFFALDFLGNDPGKEDFLCCLNEAVDGEANCLICSYKYCCCHKFIACYKREGPLIRSANYLCHLLLLIEIVVISILAKIPGFKSVPYEIYILILLIIFEGIAVCVVQCLVDWRCGFCQDSAKIPFYRRSIFIICTNLILYHLCWLIVGIMVNPVWGLTVLLITCFVGVGLLFSGEKICDANSKRNFVHRFCTLLAAFVGLCFVASVTVLAGQFYYGKETASDIVKTVLLYVVAGISWIFSKGQKTSSDQNPPAQVTPVYPDQNHPSSSTSTREDNQNTGIPIRIDPDQDDPSSSTSSLRKIKKGHSGGTLEEKTPLNLSYKETKL